MLKNISKETKILLILLFISGIIHGYNMFHFPYYENDEGVYMSQAWSILKEGKLAPYTYWYDHAPLGWVFIALWVLLSGGFFTFGFSVNSGRVLMLILHLFGVFFLFKITKYISKSTIAATIAVLFFSLSPLGLYYQRRVLLDNIMTFWFLLSVYCLIREKIKLRNVILSAFSFGIAILSKENAIFFLPVLFFFLYLRAHKSHRTFALGLWVVIVGSIVSTYFLLAILKGELFPSGTILGGTSPHVSIISSLREQVGRGANAPITDFKNNQLWVKLREWIDNDAAIIYLGIIATIVNLLIGLRNKFILFASLLSLFFWVFLIRGGVVLEFYVLPLLPIFAMNIGISVVTILQLLLSSKLKLYYKYAAVVVLLAICIWYMYKGGVIFHQNLFTSDQTTPQIQAIDWMKTHSIPGSFIVIDNYGYIELHDKSLQKGNYAYAEWYWKVDEDPQIRSILNNDPSNITYIGETQQMQSDVQIAGLTLVGNALKNASAIKVFYKDNWGITIWATHYPKQISSLAWNSYKQNFILPDGATVDPYRNYATTSEGQSYTLLRAVWMNDKNQFDRSWQWTKINMQKDQKLFSWYVEEKNNTIVTKKTDSATDADEDIALSLLFAYARWRQNIYLQEAKQIVAGIWNYDIKQTDQKPFIVAGDWAKNSSDAIINTSYFAPYEYRIFAQVDTTHNWKEVIDSSYAALNACSDAQLDKTTSVGLPPNWCSISNSGIVKIADKNIGDSNYSYDAFRVPWRIALDYVWYKETRAKQYFLAHKFLENQWIQNKKIIVGYTHDGGINQNYESAGAYGANLGMFLVIDPTSAKEIYNQKILPKFYIDANNSYWEDPRNYYVQNWAWFGTSLYFGKLDNLWEERQDTLGDVLLEQY